MASTFVTLPTPFLHRTTSFSSSNNTFPVLKRHSFKVNALVSNKWEPTKVFVIYIYILRRFSHFHLSFGEIYSIFFYFLLQVVPQADRVLIRLEALPDKTTGGVLLPKSAVKFERYLMGEILSVGAEAGEEVKAGSKVLFTDMNAYEVDLGTDEKHCFCKASDLLAVVE
ncbi:10 kDa chaperonin 1, chloroplastic-like isoform X1 [Arachis stenosperma]|uniref:10 kDa chaperonin 1, chloroplastic-like isoform X1 n=1 Tax=Arachis stenosperma TaxID=217475 RepID=UPI0025ABB61F|nr:10 kDa chaperonin 1, chloroplastic-like isoform X1 [Arachis stenosperma]